MLYEKPLCAALNKRADVKTAVVKLPQSHGSHGRRAGLRSQLFGWKFIEATAAKKPSSHSPIIRAPFTDALFDLLTFQIFFHRLPSQRHHFVIRCEAQAN